MFSRGKQDLFTFRGPDMSKVESVTLLNMFDTKKQLPKWLCEQVVLENKRQGWKKPLYPEVGGPDTSGYPPGTASYEWVALGARARTLKPRTQS